MSQLEKPNCYQDFEKHDLVGTFLKKHPAGSNIFSGETLSNIQKTVRKAIQENAGFNLLDMDDDYLNFGEKEDVHHHGLRSKKSKNTSLGNLRQALQRIFRPKNKSLSYTPATQRTLYILLIYVSEDPTKSKKKYNLNSEEGVTALKKDTISFFEYHKNLITLENTQKVKRTIVRKWVVYIRNTYGVHRTYLDIKLDNTATYASKKGVILSGPVQYEYDQLMMTLTSSSLPGYFLTLRVLLTEDMLKRDHIRISGLALANGTDKNSNFALPFVLSYDSNYKRTPIESFQTARSNAEIKTLSNRGHYFVPTGRIERDIVRFLAAEKAINSFYFPPGSKSIPSDLLSKKIESLGRSSYSDECGKILEGEKWVSLSRKGNNVSSEMIIWYWRFNRNDITQSIKAEIHNHPSRTDTSYYEGEVKVFNNEYWIYLTKGTNQKVLFGRMSNEEPKTILLVSSYQGEESEIRYATREILVPEDCLPPMFHNKVEKEELVENNEEEDKKPELSYKDFSELPKPSDFVKMYLNYKNHGRLSFPNWKIGSSRYGKERKARPFRGKYFLYVKGVYPENKDRIVRFRLEIDRLSRAELTKSFAYGTEALFHYVGVAEKTNNTLYLHLSNQNESKRQACRIMFHVNDGDASESVRRSSTLIGILLDTDKASFPIANTCIAVKVDDIHESEFAPSQVIDEIEEQFVWEELDELNKTNYSKAFDPKVTSLAHFFGITTDRNGSILLLNQYKTDEESAKAQTTYSSDYIKSRVEQTKKKENHKNIK